MAKAKEDKTKQKATLVKVLRYLKPYWFFLFPLKDYAVKFFHGHSRQRHFIEIRVSSCHHTDKL